MFQRSDREGRMSALVSHVVRQRLPLILSVILLAAVIGSGCSRRGGVEGRVNGDWIIQRTGDSQIPVTIASGVVSLRSNGAIYFKFRFLDKTNALVTLYDHNELVLSVKHPDYSTMLWWQPSNSTPYFTFTRG